MMACGHTLRSRKSCEKGGDCKDTTVRRRFLGDSCAACHATMHMSHNRALYEAEHAVLMADYRHARGRGDEAEMGRLSREMVQLARLARQRNFAVSLTRGEPSGDVIWPRDGDEDGDWESGGGRY